MTFTTEFNNNVISSASNECSRLELSCTSVTWEDTGRMKNSCWGLNISDMTLRVSPERALCPVIRKPNFSDVTSDLKIDKFNVAVGNERGGVLETIPLSQFLKNINSYIGGGELADMKTGVFAERDSHILTSVQYCVLPIQNQFVEFNVALYNYNTRSPADSAVLTIVASSQGTSVQTLKTQTTDLRFNDNGRMCDFKAQRLEDYRKDIGDTNQSTTLSTKEQEKNVLFVFQVPLKTALRPRPQAVAACCANGDDECDSFSGVAAAACAGGLERTRSASRGMSSAILSKGSDKGVFEQITQKLVRDERFPIRCTIQYYMVTDQGNVSSSMIQEMKNKIEAVYSNGDNIGSLVTNTVGNGVVRPTESVQPNSPFMIKLPTNQSKLVSPMTCGNDATPSLLMNWL